MTGRARCAAGERGWETRVAEVAVGAGARREVGAPRVEELAPPATSKALELRRFSDPGLVEAPTPAPMVAYRCVHSVEQAFGVVDPDRIAIGPHRVPGYLVCVHGRSYIQALLLASACEECPDGAVLELSVPAGTPALWIAGTGDPSTVNGADLICLDNVSIELTGRRTESNTLILEFTVLPD